MSDQNIPAPAQAPQGVEATHILEGRLLVQRTGRTGTTYYVDVETGRRASLNGAAPVALASPETLAAETDPRIIPAELLADLANPSAESIREWEAADQPTIEIPFDVYAIAVGALSSTFGAVDRGAYSGRKLHERSVVLTMPGEGGDVRYLIEFPETMAVAATPYTGEE